jgi:GntR family transcriptional regulator
VFGSLDPKSAVPLYEQIAVRLKAAVATGELRAGDALPSVRQLAARLRVNPATVVQAYRGLEDAGFVELRQGAGTFVRNLAAEVRTRERTAQARRLARQMVAEAARYGLSRHELRDAIRLELDGGGGSAS